MGERSYAEQYVLLRRADQHGELDASDAIETLETADAEIAALKAENERLRGQAEDLQAKGIHTCHDQCQRVECVLRRELSRANQFHERLAGRVAELEAALRERDGGPWPEPEQIGRIESPSSGG
jgi:predicted RNase H-like nuclease (RuvC/YqgF family)